MKILYDYQAFYMQRFGGISNCFVQLMRNLPRDVKFNVAVSESNNVHLRESGILDVPPITSPIDSFIEKRNNRWTIKLYNICSSLAPSITALGRNRSSSIKQIKTGDFDVFHPTFYDDYFLPYLNRKPFVLTVHDMIPELFWSGAKRDIQLRNKPHLCRKAAHIIAVSEKTKQDLMEFVNVPAEKISVIYHGAPEQHVNANESPIVKGQYILYVGQRNKYKNFVNMLTQAAPVLKAHPNVNVVCTGAAFSKEEVALINRLGLNDRMIQLQASDHELMNLYTYALFFIYPSLYEGFGIPILEAYKAGCPVLLNHKSCFPEIAQDAATFFHLDENQSDLAEMMERFFLLSKEEIGFLKNKQYERLQSFSWEASAKKLAEVYQKASESIKS